MAAITFKRYNICGIKCMLVWWLNTERVYSLFGIYMSLWFRVASAWSSCYRLLRSFLQEGGIIDAMGVFPIKSPIFTLFIKRSGPLVEAFCVDLTASSIFNRIIEFTAVVKALWTLLLIFDSILSLFAMNCINYLWVNSLAILFLHR